MIRDRPSGSVEAAAEVVCVAPPESVGTDGLNVAGIAPPQAPSMRVRAAAIVANALREMLLI
jgi:hypothetical protein